MLVISEEKQLSSGKNDLNKLNQVWIWKMFEPIIVSKKFEWIEWNLSKNVIQKSDSLHGSVFLNQGSEYSLALLEILHRSRLDYNIWHSFCSFFYSQTYSEHISLSCDVINCKKEKNGRESRLFTQLLMIYKW